MGTIRAICVSEKKGTQKRPVPQAELKTEWGLLGDAHAGVWHRQVSLLGLDQIEAFRARGARVDFGAFGENLVVEGYRMRDLPVGTVLRAGPVLLQITQIGKQCHSKCAIYETMGDCIMPREGVFARVLQGGTLRPGDAVTIIQEGAQG